MKIKMMPIGKVLPFENNPRINKAAVSAVAKSIAEFGFRQPIVVDEKCVVIIGHTRLKAAQELGLKMVPVHVASLPKEKVRALRIAGPRRFAAQGKGSRAPDRRQQAARIVRMGLRYAQDRAAGAAGREL